MSEHEHPEIPGGPEVDYSALRAEATREQSAAEKHAVLPKKVTTLELPEPSSETGEILETGGALVILQVNAQDKRENLAPGEEFGQLVPEAAEAARDHAKTMIEQLLRTIPEDQRDTVDVMVFASDVKLATPTGATSEHRRAYETAEKILDGIKEAGIPAENIINSLGGDDAPLPVESLKDLRVLEGIGVPEEEQTEQEKRNAEYVAYLINKYGKTTDVGHGTAFWEYYERDEPEDKQKREELKAEGPHQVAERVHDTMATIARTASGYMLDNPGRRLVVWVDSHYDTISPYVKESVVGLGEYSDRYLGFSKGSGLVMAVPAAEFQKSAESAAANSDIPALRARTTIGDNAYSFNLAPGKSKSN